MAENYKRFLELQYFDSQGMFISLIYSAPVLVNCVIILVSTINSLKSVALTLSFDSSDQLVHLLGKSSGRGEKERTFGSSTEFGGKEKGRLRCLLQSQHSCVLFCVFVLFTCQIIVETLLNDLLCEIKLFK